NLLLLRAGAFDTTQGDVASANSLAEPDLNEQQLYLVQFIGPIKNQWLNDLRSDAEIVGYIPNNAYLIRATGDNIARINNLRSTDGSFVQWSGIYRPTYKIAPEISIDSDEEIICTVQLASGRNTSREIRDLIARSSATLIGEPTSVLTYTNIRIKVR